MGQGSKFLTNGGPASLYLTSSLTNKFIKSLKDVLSQGPDVPSQGPYAAALRVCVVVNCNSEIYYFTVNNHAERGGKEEANRYSSN
ncbi:Aldehyde dehydrogenase [NAD(P)+] 2 [Frankliniella fusca]|uniref:Aldehyde dehydrogenase [NAD(P)+] 2 n=1 Tax=Frankliniella fusca TaxID=407009 RepID=A0AAE1H4Y1_9NEOP|nr:Aldehyde dehydrogenase [NAD(P)+] 2 [Frankliniella fusca]